MKRPTLWTNLPQPIQDAVARRANMIGDNAAEIARDHPVYCDIVQRYYADMNNSEVWGIGAEALGKLQIKAMEIEHFLNEEED